MVTQGAQIVWVHELVGYVVLIFTCVVTQAAQIVWVHELVGCVVLIFTCVILVKKCFMLVHITWIIIFTLVTGVIFYMGQNFLLGFKIFVWVKILCMGQTFLCRSDFFCVVKLILYGLNFFSSLGIFFALVWFTVFRLWFTKTVNKFNQIYFQFYYLKIIQDILHVIIDFL